MRINKEYNVEEIIKEVERCIEVTRQKNIGINISIDILTAQAVVDILKTIPENGSEESKEGKAGCFGNYNEDEYELCEMCELLEDCQEATKNGELENKEKKSAAKCYGNYDKDDMACMLCELERDCKEATKNGELEKPHCFGEHTNNCELMYKKTPCEFIDECRAEKENRTGAENE